MHIIVDLTFIKPGINGGTQTYIDNLLHEFTEIKKMQITCLTTNTNNEYYEHLGLNCYKLNINGHSRISRFIFYQIIFNKIIKQLKGDILFCPGNMVPFFVKCSSVVVVHDMNYRDIPEHIPFLRKIPYRFLVPWSMYKSKYVITPSYFSKNQIRKYYNIHDSKIHVIYPGIILEDTNSYAEEWENIRVKYNIHENIICTIGKDIPHKNIERLIKAFILMHKNANTNYQLVIIGHYLNNNMVNYIQNNNLSEYIIGVGSINDHDKNIILKNSKAYVHPSLYEGFGFPIIEAQSLGVPVLSSEYGSLLEIGSDSVMYCNTLSESNIAYSIDIIINDTIYREQLIQKGYQNIERFTWKQASNDTIKVFERVLKY